MRKVVMFNMISIDGYFAGIDGDISWHNVDKEFNNFAIETLRKFDTIIFGRVTYELFEGYWPKASLDPKTSKEDKTIADMINRMNKIVFSKSLNKVTWNSSRLLNGNIENEVRKLKQENGLDIVIYGSGTIVDQLTKANLIDEYNFMVNPIILGNGKSLFKSKTKLKLIKERSFRGGNVLLTYTLD